MTDAANNDGKTPFNFRIPPWVMLLFFGPIVLAVVMYYAGTQNLHGILLPEPSTLPTAGMILPDGTTAVFGGKWSLLYVGQGDCDKACKEALSRTREAHLALGKVMSNLQRFFIPTSGAPNAAALAAEDPDLIVLTDRMASLNAVLTTLGEYSEGDIYLADPRGKVVLRFPAGTATKDMQADLALLLKESQSG
ncbi:MAG: hypothetical protein R3F24_11885 [Gammaproteobacteria bacterium]